MPFRHNWKSDVILSNSNFGDKFLCKETKSQTILPGLKAFCKEKMNILMKANNQNYLHTFLLQIPLIHIRPMKVLIDMSK